MNKVLKKALGFVGALGLTAVMVLVAAPVQAQTMAMEKAPSVEDRIKGLEAEIAKLKQGQESAQLDALAQALGLLKQDLAKLKAEQKEERITAVQASIDQLPSKRLAALEARAAQRPSFGYRPGGGVTVAAADNTWSVNLRHRFQVYSTIYADAGDDDKYSNGVLRIRRHRPRLIVSSQQGFYRLDTQFNISSGGHKEDEQKHVATGVLNGDMYVNFGRMNPWLPNLGYGRSPAFSASKAKGSGIENSLLTDAADLGGQDRSIVLAWSGLPAMGNTKITHLNVAFGHDNNGTNQYERVPTDPDSKTVSFGIGVQPLAKTKAMGGLNVSNITYSMGYTSRPDKKGGLKLDTNYLVSDVVLANTASVEGDHTYMEHGLNWSPIGFLGLNANFAAYEADGNGDSLDASEFLLGARVQVWGPKSGLMGGGGAEGGISIAPSFSTAELESGAGTADVSKFGLAIAYAVPGGGMSITGMFDTYGCDTDDDDACEDLSAVGGVGADSFSVFTVAIDYRF